MTGPVSPTQWPVRPQSKAALVFHTDEQELGPADRGLTAVARATLEANQAAQANAFEHGIPSAYVVRLLRANHYIFLSNETEVLRDIEEFTGTLH